MHNFKKLTYLAYSDINFYRVVTVNVVKLQPKGNAVKILLAVSEDSFWSLLQKRFADQGYELVTEVDQADLVITDSLQDRYLVKPVILLCDQTSLTGITVTTSGVHNFSVSLPTGELEELVVSTAQKSDWYYRN